MLNIVRQVVTTVSQVVETELGFMAHHPVALAVAAVAVGLVAFVGYRASAR